MRVRDLGALAVVVDRTEHAVTGRRAAGMLALLTIHANQRVSLDALVDAAWGDHVPPGASSTLDSHLWRLRRLLEPGRGRRSAPTVLVSDGGGYRLVADVADVDSLLFAELAHGVRDAARDPSVALARADETLALWRGRPYGPLADLDWARAAVDRLVELHGQVRERRVEALLETGMTDRSLADLEPLIAEMPFRESLRGLQMTALHRSGRSEEALGVYQRTRRLLVEEVGTEPGARLRELHQRILDDDGVLAASPRSVPRQRSHPASEPRLPTWMTPLVGRDDDARRLTALLAEHRLVTVVGAAGCGKTRLGVEVARTEAHRFPDGVWFVDLAAVTDPGLVLDAVVSTIRMTGATADEPLEDLREYLRARTLLLVLDNCEHVLPAVARIAERTLGDASDTPACSILATSREPLGVDGETIWTLDPLGLPADSTTSDGPAVELFVHRARAAAPTLRLDGDTLGRAAEICVALDGLPLPIELAAARVRSHTLSDIAAQVSADPGRLRGIHRRHPGHRATLRSTIDWSHRLLTFPERVAHRRLAALPGPFTVPMAAAVVGDVPDADVDDLLAALVHRSMLASDAPRRPEGSTRFRQLATVRAHAAHALAEAGETAAAHRRRDAWTAALLEGHPPLGAVEEIAWYATIDDGYATVRSTLARHLIEEPSVLGARLAVRLVFYWYYRGRIVEGARWLQLARDALGESDPADVMVVETLLASALLALRRADHARPHVDDALARLPYVPDDRLVEAGEALVTLGVAAWPADAVDVIVAVHRHLTDVVGRVDAPGLEVLTDAVGALVAVATEPPRVAIEKAEAAHRRAVDAGNILAGWVSAGPPMIIAVLTGRPGDGIPWLDRLVRGHVRLGTGGGGLFLENRANFAAQAERWVEAATLYAAAQTQTRRAGTPWPRRELTAQLLDRTRGRLGDGEFDRAWRTGEPLTLRDIAEGDG